MKKVIRCVDYTDKKQYNKFIRDTENICSTDAFGARGKMNKNTQYEILAKEIFEELHRVDGFSNINIQHNVLLKGKSGQEHQVDVYWEFKIADQNYKVAIECKNYTHKISIGKVRDFFGVLYDIGNIQGIMVTKKGYQLGAKVFAKYYGIDLKEIRFPNNEDWGNRLKKVDITGHLHANHINNIEVVFDLEWIRENRKELKGKQISVSCKAIDFKIFDYEGKEQYTIENIVKDLPVFDEEQKTSNYFYKLNNGFINDNNFGILKLSGLNIDYTSSCIESKIHFDAEEIVKAIIKDVDKNEIKFFYNK